MKALLYKPGLYSSCRFGTKRQKVFIASTFTALVLAQSCTNNQPIMKKQSLLVWIMTAIVPITAIKCVPTFSEMQSARTAGKNNIETTSYYTSVSYAEQGQSEGIQTHFGAQAAYGISSNFDIRVRYEYIWLKKAVTDQSTVNDGINVLAIGPKFSLLENKIALSLPIGRAFGSNTQSTWQIHPTLILTYPVMKEKIDVSVSPKYMMSFSKQGNDMIAVNFGMSLSTNLSKWAIRPEYGYLWGGHMEGSYRQFSIGLSTTLGL